jgi:diguanylate cyclase (GGDEF)-like protein
MYLPYLMCGYAATVILMLAGCYAFSRTAPGLRGLRLLVYALLCGLGGVLLIAVRPVAPAWATILLGNEALFVCSLLIYSAAADILAVPANFHPWGIGVLVAAFAAMHYFTYSHDNLTARIFVCSVCFAIFAGAKAQVLFAYRDPVSDPGLPASALRSLVTSLAWLQVMIAALQLARVILTVLYPPREIVHLDIIQSGFTYLNLVLNAGGGFGLTWLALSMHRRDLHRIAQTDGLTGLLNRRAFEEILARELMRSNRMEKSLTLLLLDIDRFKEVNDTWGHQAGDEVIRRVASALQCCLRPGDALSRYGGEEFVILLRDASADHAEEVAGRLRARIASLGDLPGSVRLTVSIGVAASRSQDPPEELLRRCDEAMYRSKRGGRNLVTVDRSAGDRSDPAAAQASA